MTTKLTIEQRNNLLVGNTLAAELPASADDVRAWVEVRAYSTQSTRFHWVPVSKSLNADRSDQRYQLQWCEIDKEYYNHWTDADYFIRQEGEIRDLMSIEAVEEELAKYLDDFSRLQVSWKTESPRG
jgi:hypothetical protein